MTTPAGSHLLDVNVLLALAWPQPVHHARAHECFDRVGARALATYAITQLGFVRISRNPRLTVAGVTARAAVSLLAEFVQLPGHRYLVPLPAPTGAPLFVSKSLLGHGQVTDLYLLALAIHHGCRVATLDAGISQLLASDEERGRSLDLIE